ncbi:MAG: site-specific integrase [Oscillospiraceae bacterium]|nr:site-specific integrase [Oscillospiraceae bacterium]
MSEANQLMRHLREEPLWFHVATLMGLLIALRRSEIVGACESEIDWEQNRILIDQTITQQTIDGRNTITRKPFTKNRKAKDLLLVGSLSALIKELIEEHKTNRTVFGEQYDHTWDGYLIRYPDGKLVSPNALTNKFKKFLEKHNLKRIRFYDLRHSCASILCAKGVSIRVIQGILGHAQLATTQMYTQIINDQQDTALIQMSEEIMGESDES